VKTIIKYLLQKTLGFEKYLFLFSLFIIKKLRWDRNERDFLHFLNLLPEEGIALDIGANIGVMSYYLARKHTNRKVFAFEPVPYNFRNMEKIKTRYALENLSIFQIALGDQNGKINIVLPVQKSVRFHGLAHVVTNANQGKKEGEVFERPVYRLDDFNPLREKSLPVTGIKIDVENHEYFVFKGAAELIQKHKPIIYCELWDNENRKQSMELLTRLGYQTMILENGKLTAYIPVKHTTQNFFFIPVQK
jgi:FkbM family methyltransferase